MSPAGHCNLVHNSARRTHDRRKGLKALHTLSAYATTARLTLAQLSVPEKTNEITAIPELLDALEVARANPHREVICFAVGFETTAPPWAMAVVQAKALKLPNFSLLVAHVLVHEVGHHFGLSDEAMHALEEEAE